MKNASLIIVATALFSTGACGSDPFTETDTKTPPTPAQRFCAAVADHVARCGSSTPCDDALVHDCAGVAGILSDSYLGSAAECIEKGGAPLGCLKSSAGSIEPSQAHRDFAAKFCDQCVFGVSGCEDAFFSEESGDTQAVGAVILPFGDALVKEIGEECAKGLMCIPGFPSCAQGVLAKRAIPEATIACMLNPPDVPEGQAEGCGAGGSGSGGTADSTSSSGSSSSGTGGNASCESNGECAAGETCKDGVCQSECVELSDPVECAGCCQDHDPNGYDAYLLDVLNECGCNSSTRCNVACQADCGGSADRISTDCLVCLSNEILVGTACADAAASTCQEDSVCASFFGCYSGCP